MTRIPLIALALFLVACQTTNKPAVQQFNVKSATAPATVQPSPIEKVSATLEHCFEFPVWLQNSLFADWIVSLPGVNITIHNRIPQTVPNFTLEK